MAEPSQTTEGAQKFLAAITGKTGAQLWFTDAQGRVNVIRGKAVRDTRRVEVLDIKQIRTEKDADKQLPSFAVTEMDSLDGRGHKDACVTRIPKLSLQEPLLVKREWEDAEEGVLFDTPILIRETTQYEPPTDLLGPHWIDWRDVKLSRAGNERIAVSFRSGKLTGHFVFTPGERELADRLEYAMKFLQRSCDDVGATGF